MAKKKTTQSTEPIVEPPLSFDQLCQDFRAKKVLADAADKELVKARTQLNNYVIEHGIEKGNYNGVNIQERFKFLPSNIDIATENHLAVPFIIEYKLKLSEERINFLIQKGHLKSDEVEKSETPDLKKLEKLMEEKKIPAEYERSYAFGLGKE